MSLESESDSTLSVWTSGCEENLQKNIKKI